MRQMKGKGRITWIQFACARHEVLIANGCLQGSLLLGPIAANAPSSAECQAVTNIFGAVSTPGEEFNGLHSRLCLTVGAVKRRLAKHPKDKGLNLDREIRKWDRDPATEKYETEHFSEAEPMAKPQEKARRVA
ncbi:hypothetical protein EU803_00645 [Loktanella sp. IMCC34160]|uniref:hypothetical protein n=1 Tax=Loktanella sp. IMCC34160 TaxID=2510646 RepID=UPI00101C7C08|nr:hypothetical protein [Loktanella sp. IMCC34160]RYG92647.1 hypothetical protein EU803_00645 [Loktanella sp. IMCC34160]